MRTINDAEKWPILPEMLKADEQLDAIVSPSALESETRLTENTFNVEATEFQSKLNFFFH